MGELGAFLKITRADTPERAPGERVHDHREFVKLLPLVELKQQGARCMECGVPFCHHGCPLGNLIPDWNDLVYRERFAEAIEQLHRTNNFPEFTGRLCPAPCEAACVLEIDEGNAVTIKQIELAIVDRAWEEGWIVPQPPPERTGRTIVVGGGEPGAECGASAHREGAAAVTQTELLGHPPAHRPDDLTPWPLWPIKLRTSYALKEGGERSFAVSTPGLSGDGRVERIHWVENSGTPPFDPVPGTEETRPADLVLLAMGFLGPEQQLLEALGVERDGRSNAAAPAFATSVAGVFAAGDARRGQSLIVWAIDEGRRCARAVDAWLASDDAPEPVTVSAAGSA